MVRMIETGNRLWRGMRIALLLMVPAVPGGSGAIRSWA